MADRVGASVVHVIGRLEVGGAETMLLGLCREMGPRVDHQTVITLGRDTGRLTPVFAAAGVRVIACPLSADVGFVTRFHRIVRDIRPTVLISHVSLATTALLLLGRLAGVRTRIAVFHSEGDGRPDTVRRRAYRSMMRRALPHVATHIVGVTSATLAFGGARGRKALVIPNGVDMERFRPGDRGTARTRLGVSPGAVLVTHLGRGAPEKNRKALPAILDALPPTYRMAVAGSETVADIDPGQVAGLPTRMSDFGVLDRVEDLLDASDVVVLPSTREGLPMVVLEALAAGCPVIATDLPGLRELSVDLPDLVLVGDPNDSRAWAAAIEHVVATRRPGPQIRSTVAAAGLDLAAVARQWEALCGV